MGSSRSSGMSSMEMLEKNKTFFKALFTDGLENVHAIAPHVALKLITEISEDIPFKYSNNELREIEKGLLQDYLFLENFDDKKYRGLINSLTQDEQSILKGLLKWLINELKSWDEAKCSVSLLSLIFIISDMLSENLWELIPPDLINNSQLNEFLEGRFGRFHYDIVIPQHQHVPIWEKEAVQPYMAAIKERDWLYMANNWHLWGRSPKFGRANIFQYQIFLYLLKYSQGSLLLAIEKYEDFFSLMLICREHDFSLLQRFKLACDTTNELFRFSLLFALELNNSQYNNLTDKEADFFARALQKMSGNLNQLSLWLIIFNRYLVRFQILAEGFGIYLAKYASEREIDLYLESIKLDAINLQNGYDDSRRILNTTFQKFATLADIAIREIFWSKCYRKWLNWNFGQAEDHYHLYSINLTNLDYAIVGYFIECQDQTGREQVVKSILRDVDSIFTKNWYASESEIKTQFYNLLSKLQTVSHAIEIIEGEQGPWIMQSKRVYLSTRFQVDDRYKIAFDLDHLKP